jgi:hypothetical protein
MRKIPEEIDYALVSFGGEGTYGRAGTDENGQLGVIKYYKNEWSAAEWFWPSWHREWIHRKLNGEDGGVFETSMVHKSGERMTREPEDLLWLHDRPQLSHGVSNWPMMANLQNTFKFQDTIDLLRNRTSTYETKYTPTCRKTYHWKHDSVNVE